MRIAPPNVHAARLLRVRAALDAQRLDGLIVTNLQNVAYLTGLFASAAALVVTREDVRLVTDNRYSEVLQARVRDWPALTPILVPHGTSYDEVLVQQLRSLAGLRVGFEDADLSVRRLRYFETAATSGPQAELLPAAEVVEDVRIVKDEWELGVLRDAAGRLSDVAKCILPNALAGSTERGIVGDLEAAMRYAGFERPAFDTIVAAGPNAALPHYRSGDRRLEAGDLVLIDFGGVLDGYAVDMTRTVAVGAAGSRERQVIEAVAAAQKAAIHRAGPGVAPEAVDAAAREALADAGLGEAFVHSTGHGLGLDVHERPRIGPARPGVTEPLLEAGMVFTVEPGAYLPGWGGVRIEDDVVVTATGVEVLTDAPYDEWSVKI